MTDKMKTSIGFTGFLILYPRLESFPTEETCFSFLLLFLPPIFNPLDWFSLDPVCFVLQKFF